MWRDQRSLLTQRSALQGEVPDIELRRGSRQKSREPGALKMSKVAAMKSYVTECAGFAGSAS
jgi:hypothetical protein